MHYSITQAMKETSKFTKNWNLSLIIHIIRGTTIK